MKINYWLYYGLEFSQSLMQTLTQSYINQKESKHMKLVIQFGITLAYIWGQAGDKNPLKMGINMNATLTFILIKINKNSL